MKPERSYWIKERRNPQLDKPYYVACGQLGMKAAKKKEKSLYGYNIMWEYKTLEQYNQAIDSFKAAGYVVHNDA